VSEERHSLLGYGIGSGGAGDEKGKNGGCGEKEISTNRWPREEGEKKKKSTRPGREGNFSKKNLGNRSKKARKTG